ncbi:MAG TPA: hypothetical protein VFT70_07065 [Nocardioides sp.]|nr:hypothetical protein [Nocardioides sp.]
MNSSGIKRGLAGSAVAALAVTGLPFLASSADAAAGDTITVVSTGPARNGGNLGADVVLRVKDGTVVPGDLELTSTTSPTSGSQNNADQNAEILSADAPVNDSTDNAYELITLHVQVTTANTGDTATFRVFEDESGDPTPTLDAAEPRATVSVTTAGAASALVVSPNSQSTPQGIESGNYTATVQDSAGRTTQLQSGETVALTSDADITINESGSTIDAAEISDGTDTFSVTPTGAAALGAHTITLNGPGSVDTTASVTVTQSATLTAAMVDIVTGADSWDGFGGGAFGGANTEVRVDQGTIRIDIKGGAGNANSTVSLNLNGAGGTTPVTFGGKTTATVSTVLDADGNGSLTITPDAGTVQEGDTIALAGSFAETLEFARAHVADIASPAGTYFSKVGGTVDVTVQVLDQFGLPITSGFVEASRDGVNAAADATPQRKAVGADGTATFSFTDTKATNGQTENVDVDYFADQFSATPDFSEGNVTKIKYTTDGMGANFGSSLDGKNTEATDYDASDVVVVPLADTVADEDGGNHESAALAVTGGEPGAGMTISVDNGALILAPGKTKLSEGKASVTDKLDGVTGNLPSGYRVVGTKSGVVTVTMSAANRTETAQFTVGAETDDNTARNVTVSGPAEVEHGTTQIAFTAVVTDGFGNPVSGLSVGYLNIQVTGPAQFQDSDAMTNANGQLNLNVRVDADAEGDVSIKVQGLYAQFGAAADELYAGSGANSGKGLPASSNVATATTTVKAGEVTPPPVENPVAPHMKVKGIDKGKRDVIRVNAIDEASGAQVTLFKRKANGSLKRIKAAELNEAGNFTFRVHDGNGAKATRYTVKLKGNDMVRPANKSRRVK